jgi:hypothetical protein
MPLFSSVSIDKQQAVLRHLQSKETALDDILEKYGRNSHKLIDKLLYNQSIELCQAAAAFNERCVELGGLFKDSARRAKMIRRKVSNGGNQHLKDWEQRKAELEEGVRKAREALASI